MDYGNWATERFLPLFGVGLVLLGCVTFVLGFGLGFYNSSVDSGEVVLDSGGDVVVVDDDTERVVSLSEVGGSNVRGEYVNFESLSDSEQEVVLEARSDGEVVVDGEDGVLVGEKLFSTHVDGELVVLTVSVSDVWGGTSPSGQSLFLLISTFVLLPLGMLFLVVSTDL